MQSHSPNRANRCLQPLLTAHAGAIETVMAQFRAKKLDLGCFVSTRVIRDHTKRQAERAILLWPMLTSIRKVFAQHETERYAPQIRSMHLLTSSNSCASPGVTPADGRNPLDKPSATSSAIPPSRNGPGHKLS